MAKLGSFAVSQKQHFLNVIAHFLPIFVRKISGPFRNSFFQALNLILKNIYKNFN